MQAWVLSHVRLFVTHGLQPGSSADGILQARILEWVAISSSRASSWPRDWARVSCIFCIGRQILYHWPTWETLLGGGEQQSCGEFQERQLSLQEYASLMQEEGGRFNGHGRDLKESSQGWLWMEVRDLICMSTGWSFTLEWGGRELKKVLMG